MDVKQAVVTAKRYVLELFEDEAITDIGLEEIEFDGVEGLWQVTIGFTRPWDQNIGSVLGDTRSRTYKKILIRDRDHEVLSVKNRTTSQEQ